jgi:hypothetical protein
MHASIAAALGAGGLAVAANMHEWMTASSYRPSIAIALAAWPLLTGVSAFVVAMIAAPLLHRWAAPLLAESSVVQFVSDGAPTSRKIVWIERPRTLAAMC